MTIPGEFFNKYLPCRICGQLPSAPGDLAGHHLLACEGCWIELGLEVGMLIQRQKDKKMLDDIAAAGYSEPDARKIVLPRRLQA